MKVAIVDYGSGNLHSAHKAFERAAREAETSAQIEVTADPACVLAADRVVLPGVGAFADCRRGLDAVGGMVEAIRKACAVVAGRSLAFASACSCSPPAARSMRWSAGLDWIPGDVAVDPPVRSRAEDPAYGLEHPRCAPAACAARGRACGVARLFRAFLSTLPGRARRRRRDGRLRRPDHRAGGA